MKKITIFLLFIAAINHTMVDASVHPNLFPRDFSKEIRVKSAIDSRLIVTRTELAILNSQLAQLQAQDLTEINDEAKLEEIAAEKEYVRFMRKKHCDVLKGYKSLSQKYNAQFAAAQNPTPNITIIAKNELEQPYYGYRPVLRPISENRSLSPDHRAPTTKICPRLVRQVKENRMPNLPFPIF